MSVYMPILDAFIMGLVAWFGYNMICLLLFLELDYRIPGVWPEPDDFPDWYVKISGYFFRTALWPCHILLDRIQKILDRAKRRRMFPQVEKKTVKTVYPG